MRYQFALSGCTIEPMAAYLKAIAVFRLVSEQADSTARGFWRGREFHLDSELDGEALERFFLEQYRPTPIVAPWNDGGGFSEGERRIGINAILASVSPRLEDYRQTIREILSWPEFGGGEMTLGQMLTEVQTAANATSGRAQAELHKLISDVKVAAGNLESLFSLTTQQINRHAKPVYKSVKKLRTAAKKLNRSGGKDETVRLCRNQLPDRAVDWIDSAVVLRTTRDLKFPPILGTGGNEGHLEYTHWFAEKVADLLLGNHPPSANLIRNALFAAPTGDLTRAPAGQLDPGRAGGYNQGPGVETEEFPTNHWNFVLAMEGAVAWAGSACRRHGVATYGAFCSPFTVFPKYVGYDSSSAGDEHRNAVRAEVWMPIWDRACRFEEFRSLLREGRVEWSGRPVNNALEFSEALAALGADRGISAFQRYSLINRRGKDYLALPSGRINVQQRAGVELLEDVDRLVRHIDDFSRGFKSESPARFSSVRRQLDTAIYWFALRGGVERLRDILVALGRFERYFAARDLRLDPKLDSPLFGLSPRWLLEANDGSLEFRIAAALASIGPSGEVGPFRANLTPLNAIKPWMWAEGSGQTAWSGGTLAHRMASTLKRRLMDAERLNCRSLPLCAGLRLHPEEAAVFIQPGSVDESRLEDLLFACTMIDWRDSAAEVETLESSWRTATPNVVIPREYALLKHLFDPSVSARPEPSILNLLTADRTPEACDIAIRRLRASGYTPLRIAYSRNGEGIRLAASLLIPIHSLGMIAGGVLAPQNQDER